MSKRNLKSVLSDNVLKEIARDLFHPTNTYPEEFNPFQSSLSRIRLSEYENIRLSEFLEKTILAEDIDKLSKIVDETLDSGIMINARNEDRFSFSQVVIFKIHRNKFAGKKLENVIKKLALNGANFDELGDIEICKKVRKEVEPQIHDRLKKLRGVVESATLVGTVENVEIDNKTFSVEFSQNSVVNVSKVIEGAKNLGLSNGELNSNIIKIGNGEVEVKAGENDEKNYSDISDYSSFIITFRTSLGELNLKIYHDIKNYDQVKVEVEDKETWNKLQKTGEIVGKSCLFGGVSVNEAIEKGSFMRSGRWSGNSQCETIKLDQPKSSESISWADKIKSDKTSSIARS